MAKVTGPLMSVSASGSFAGAMVFAGWKGRSYVRQLVIPMNPASAGQELARNNTRITGANQAFFNRTVMVRAGETETDKVLIAAMTPSGYAWNGYLVGQTIGANGSTIAAAKAAYTALTTLQKTAWDTAAAALSPAIPAVAQTEAGGGYIADMVAGEVHFIGQYGLSVLGLASVPTGTPPSYA